MIIYTNASFKAERVCFFDGTERRNCAGRIDGGFLYLFSEEEEATLYNLNFVKKIEGVKNAKLSAARAVTGGNNGEKNKV